MKTTIRQMRKSDLDDVLSIERKMFQDSWSRKVFASSLRSGHVGIVLLLDNQIVGYAIMLIVLDEAEILNICVTANEQKKGFGKLILEHLLKIAKERGVKNIFLEVRKSNLIAISLYQKSGFKQVGMRKGYYKTKTGREDAIVFERQ